MGRRFALTLVFAALAGSSLLGQGVRGYPQPPSLSFEGVALTLGMSEAAVRRELRRMDFSLVAPTPSGPPGMWAITAKSGQLYDFVGSVIFEADKLVSAEAVWRHNRADIDLANTLLSVVSSWQRAGIGKNCVLASMNQPNQPGFEMKLSNIECPSAGRGLTVSIHDAPSSRFENGVAVQERIFNPR
jgi:hypothetical protein